MLAMQLSQLTPHSLEKVINTSMSKNYQFLMYELPSPSCKRMATSGTFCRKTLTLFAKLILLSSVGICSQLLLWSKNPVFSFNFILREEAQTQRKKM